MLRDGAVFLAALAGLASHDDACRAPYRSGKIKASHINRAVIAAISSDPLAVDYSGEVKITKDAALAYLAQHGVLVENGGNTPLTIFLDTGSVGSLLQAMKHAIGERGRIGALYLMAENPHIPAYVPYVATGSWRIRPEDPVTRQKQQLVRDYAEDHFGSYCYRVEELTSRHGSSRLMAAIHLPNPATTLLTWVSFQAARDTGALHGRMRAAGDRTVETLPRMALDYLYAWWTHTVKDVSIPNIAFTDWPAWPENARIIHQWRMDTLEDLALQ
jgi:hypothetical protein